MSYVLTQCLTEVARLMVQLTSAAVTDTVRPVSGQLTGVLSEVTPAGLLKELRGSYGMNFIPSVVEWNEVGQSGEGQGVLYKLTAKPPRTAVYYFTIEDTRVRRITRPARA